ncbi:hypothetical protein E3E11_02425 [Oecophyllibacter saccharovorans]|uniref:hypothetical protein n=1 Tax=Oecophyllibacter saccharovorans TaxID=2558360 RepID=UPI0011443BAB|nr:hypothetical protein [Oecophyllibacter saccharovorans]QDH14902.1 hypothetical protein E3E11_02425 [Oecophyllibacter saccharovorans]
MATFIFLVLTFFSGGIFYYVRLSQILILCRNRFEPFPYKALFYSALVLTGTLGGLINIIIYALPTDAQLHSTPPSSDTQAQVGLIGVLVIACFVCWLSKWLLQLILAYRTAHSLRLKADETYGIDLPINNFLIFFFSFYYLNYILNKYDLYTSSIPT